MVGAVTFAVTASAQDDSDKRPVLHEDLTPPKDGEHRTARDVRSRQQIFGASPAEGQNPSAIEAGSKILPEPPTDQATSSQELVHGGTGFAKADRFTDYRPDLHTGSDGTLHYVEVFNPGIIPFKRMSALDSVRTDYTLYTERSSKSDVVVSGQPRADDELFWGSLVVELRTGEDVPIPSVSPDMRILSYEITPSVPVVFSKDESDNFYVRSEEPGLSGQQRRLVFSVATDRRYFRPEVPEGLQVRNIRNKPVPLPASVQKQAERALRRLRVSPSTDLKEALDRLINYHRNFEAQAPPRSDGDIYWDLFETQAGVCRHRSFVFMVTANAVGIPTRYVANEAHAWVEVWIPDNDWVRIDLGGAAMTLQVSNADGKTMRPSDPDPFPQPAAYNENYTRLEGDVQGLTGDQITEAQTSSDSGSGSSSGNGGAFFESDEADGPSDPGHMTGPGRGLPEIPPEELEGKIPTTISIQNASPSGFRGETITVSGVVIDDVGREGIAKQRVDVFLAPRGLEGEESVLVGHTVTASDGRWTAVVHLPRDLELKEYEVWASTPGDAKYQPTLSE